MSNKDLINLTVTKEEYEAIPILISMAETYLWELYDKTEKDSYWKRHKENIDRIKEYHKTHQGIMVNGFNILEKMNNKEKDENKYDEINKKYSEYMKKLSKKEQYTFIERIYKEFINGLDKEKDKE